MRKFFLMVLADERFRVPSVSAKDAVKAAEQLLEWSSQTESNNVFQPFAWELAEELDCCFKVDCCNLEYIRVNMEEAFQIAFFTLLSIIVVQLFCLVFVFLFINSFIGLCVVDSGFNSLLEQHH